MNHIRRGAGGRFGRILQYLRCGRGTAGPARGRDRRKRNGEEGREYFTIWTKDPVQEGQVFDVSGLLSVKVEEWTDKTTGEPRSRAAVSVNDPILKAPDDSPEPVKHLTLEEAFGDVKVVSADEEAPF